MSELRRNIITNKWVDIATVRAKRPDAFLGKEHTAATHESGTCVFCPGEEEATGDELFALRDGGKPNDDTWRVRVIKNKFPSFAPEEKLDRRKEGIYTLMNAGGAAEIVITRDENKFEPHMTPEEVGEIFAAYRARYRDLMDEPHVNYILIFKNHGTQAGASIAHPHSQIYALPVVSNDAYDGLGGASRYFRQHDTDPFSDVVAYERKFKKRVVFENDDFIVYCPFASRSPFEMWLVPKEHRPRFEDLPDEQLVTAGEALHEALKGLYIGLKNPPFNYFIHTSPALNRSFPAYRWHLEILPRLTKRAGFEYGTGIIVNPVPPEAAAGYLREWREQPLP